MTDLKGMRIGRGDPIVGRDGIDQKFDEIYQYRN